MQSRMYDDTKTPLLLLFNLQLSILMSNNTIKQTECALMNYESSRQYIAFWNLKHYENGLQLNLNCVNCFNFISTIRNNDKMSLNHSKYQFLSNVYLYICFQLFVFNCILLQNYNYNWNFIGDSVLNFVNCFLLLELWMTLYYLI